MVQGSKPACHFLTTDPLTNFCRSEVMSVQEAFMALGQLATLSAPSPNPFPPTPLQPALPPQVRGDERPGGVHGPRPACHSLTTDPQTPSPTLHPAFARPSFTGPR